MLTKLDGDARGGAALSIKAVTGKPIKFVGVGEKLDHDRGRSTLTGWPRRILGMGDMLSLIEKAEQNFDRQKALEFQEKLRKNKFTLTDFYEQMAQLKNMGSLSEICRDAPRRRGLTIWRGPPWTSPCWRRMEAIILSMTPYERENPNVPQLHAASGASPPGSGTAGGGHQPAARSSSTMMQAMTKQFAGGKMPKSMRRLMGKKGGKGMLGGKMPGLPF